MEAGAGRAAQGVFEFIRSKKKRFLPKKNARAAFAQRLRACDSELQFDVRLFLARPTRGLRRATLRAKLLVTTKLRSELRFKLRLSERLS